MTKKQLAEIREKRGIRPDVELGYSVRTFKIPECNGRPQMWLRGIDGNNGLRIIYPNGKVEYTHGISALFDSGCTSSTTQEEAVIKMIAYDISFSGAKWLSKAPIFIGYL
jgi:hypothetical protein